MKRLFAIFVALCAAFVAVAQSENSIIIDQNSFRPLQSDALTGVNIDPIGVDSSRRPCARIKMKINRMTREDIDKLDVKIVTNNQLTKCKTADYENGLILEMTAKPATRFYLDHPEFGQSNEVTLNLDPNKEYYMEASLNQTYSIVVNSNVTDAEVYLDGEYKGRTDSTFTLTLSEVLIGNHKLKLIYGNDSIEQRIDVHKNSINFRAHIDTYTAFENQTQTINPQMQRLTMTVNPIDAKVYIDGYEFPLMNGMLVTLLPIGNHVYYIVHNDKKQSGQFTIFSSKPKELVVDILKTTPINEIENRTELSEEEILYYTALELLKAGKDAEAENVALRGIAKNYRVCTDILEVLLLLGFYDEDPQKFESVKKQVNEWKNNRTGLNKNTNTTPTFGLG